MVELDRRQNKLVCVFQALVIKLVPKVENVLRLLNVPRFNFIPSFAVLIKHQEITSISALINSLSQKIGPLLLPRKTSGAPCYIKLKLLISFHQILLILYPSFYRLLLFTYFVIYVPVFRVILLVKQIIQISSHCPV